MLQVTTIMLLMSGLLKVLERGLAARNAGFEQVQGLAGALTDTQRETMRTAACN